MTLLGLEFGGFMFESYCYKTAMIKPKYDDPGGYHGQMSGQLLREQISLICAVCVGQVGTVKGNSEA